MDIFMLLLEHLIASAILYMIPLVNISSIKLRKAEAVFATAVLTLCAATLFTVFPAEWVEIVALVGNLVVIAVLTVAAYRKTKILPLSAFYSVSAVTVVLLSVNLSTQVLVMSGAYETRHARSYTANNLILMGMSLFLIYLFAFVISRYYGKLLQKAMDSLDSTMQSKFALYMLGGMAVTLVLFFLHTFLRFVILNDALFAVLYTLSLMFYVGFLAFAVFAFTEKFQKEAEVRYQKEHLEHMKVYAANLEKLSVGLKKFKHDHKNLLLSFQAHLENSDIEGAKKQLCNYVGYSANIMADNDTDINGLSLIKTPELHTLLVFKFLLAMQQNISVRVEISEPVEVNIDNILDLCRIFGILLDNAIEACLEAKKPELRLLVLRGSAGLALILSNSCDNVPQLNKLFEEGFSTKGEGRGMGLHTVRQILIENESFALRTGVKEGFFEQEVTVF